MIFFGGGVVRGINLAPGRGQMQHGSKLEHAAIHYRLHQFHPFLQITQSKPNKPLSHK